MIATLLIIAVLAVCYVVAGYYIRPDPDLDDMGWLGGLVNDPFRYRDNINRQLLFLTIVLLPGRLLAEGAIELVRAGLERMHAH